ncbi:MAG: hypothetical protein C5B59_12370 [Bacteroidetes bacterium]|nr:MAG: hypothetical protein C5B59_12370 [Bacteroidota bacterium]
MKISIERRDTLDKRDSAITMTVTGTPGDKKQPVDHLFFCITVSRTTASRLALAFKRAAEEQKREEIEI